MRDKNILSIPRALPRMSWSPKNLYNLWRRSLGGLQFETNFKQQRKTLTIFQQRWISKSLVRAYHGDFINEKLFKRWYLPDTIPDVRPKKGPSDQSILINKWARKETVANKQLKIREDDDEKALAPVGSLMFVEIERRIDVVIFRACLAHSVYEARRMVVHGDVLLNGKKHMNANTRLAPGDMVSVDPAAIRFIQKSAAPKEEAPEEVEAKAESAPAEDSEPSESESESSEAVSAPSESQPDSPSTSSEPTPSQVHAKTELTPREKRRSHLTSFHLPPYASPWIFVPAYLEVSYLTCSVIYLRHPTARPGYSEIPTPYDADGFVVRFAWEWYTRVRPRIRSKSQLARMPENRKSPEELAER